MAYFTSTTDYWPSWRVVILPTVMPVIVIMTSAFSLAVYAQYAIIKTEERIRNGADT